MRGEELHFCGAKLRDSNTFMLAGDLQTAEAGPAFLWKWRSDECVVARSPRRRREPTVVIPSQCDPPPCRLTRACVCVEGSVARRDL